MDSVYGVIYKIRNKVNNKLYFGQTTNKYGFKGRYSAAGNGIERVYNRYIFCKERNIGYNKHLFRSIEKYKFDNFEVEEIFDIAFNKKELDALECLYIRVYDSSNNKKGYNNKTGGSFGKHSEEVKMDQSRRMKGRMVGKNNPNYGVHRYGEMSPNWGIPCSEEKKIKIGKQNKGKLSGGKNPSARPVICITTGIIFRIMKEASEYYDVDTSLIVKCCKGKRKTGGKLVDGIRLQWMYHEDYLSKLEEVC